MKKLLLLFFSLMLSFNSYGEWSYIGEDYNGESKYYIDLKTLRKIDDYVYYWNLIDFDKKYRISSIVKMRRVGIHDPCEP